MSDDNAQRRHKRTDAGGPDHDRVLLLERRPRLEDLVPEALVREDGQVQRPELDLEGRPLAAQVVDLRLELRRAPARRRKKARLLSQLRGITTTTTTRLEATDAGRALLVALLVALEGLLALLPLQLELRLERRQHLHARDAVPAQLLPVGHLALILLRHLLKLRRQLRLQALALPGLGRPALPLLLRRLLLRRHATTGAAPDDRPSVGAARRKKTSNEHREADRPQVAS